MSFDIKYGIVAVPPDYEKDDNWEILHFCAYAEKPTKADFKGLKQELEEDEELKLDEEFVLIDAPEDVVEYFKQAYKDAEA